MLYVITLIALLLVAWYWSNYKQVTAPGANLTQRLSQIRDCLEECGYYSVSFNDCFIIEGNGGGASYRPAKNLLDKYKIIVWLDDVTPNNIEYRLHLVFNSEEEVMSIAENDYTLSPKLTAQQHILAHKILESCRQASRQKLAIN